MGAWGSGSFENDDAADWLAQLVTIAPYDLTKIFGQAADDATYFEAPAASIVVAAAEVVAALNGSPAKGVPPEIVNWTTDRQATPELKALALRALEGRKLVPDRECKRLLTSTEVALTARSGRIEHQETLAALPKWGRHSLAAG